MVGAFNVNKKLHSDISFDVIDAKDATYNTIANLTAIKCQGFTRLAVQYITTTGWDRAGSIYIYGSFTEDGTYTAPDGTIENAIFLVLHTDDTTNEGLGEYYVVENVMPWIKVGWVNTTAGSTGTVSVSVMPFNT